MHRMEWSAPGLIVGVIALSIGLQGCGGGEDQSTNHQNRGGSTARAADVSVTAQSPGYFVDASRGLDTNGGTYAAPFRTLAKAKAALIASSSVGYGIYLRCDDVNGQPNIWRESLVLDQSSAPNGIQIKGYGTCNSSVKATLTGGDDVSANWVDHGPVANPEGTTQCKHWSRTLSGATPPASRVVIWRPNVAPVTLRLAQWPNYKEVTFNAAGVLSSGSRQYAVAQAGSSTNTLNTTTNFSSLGDVVGATVQLRSSAFFIEPRLVTSVSGTTLTLDNTARENNYLEAGDGYLLQNKQWMLDSSEEFFHEIKAATANTAAVNELHVCVDPGYDMNATTTKVEASTSRDSVLSVTNRQKVVVKDVAVRMGRLYGILLKDAPGSTVSDVNAMLNGRSGIRVHGPTAIDGANTLIAGNLAQYNWVMGIDTRFASGPHTIQANSVYDTGTSGYAGGSVPAVAVDEFSRSYGYIAGISAGSGANVTSNVIHRTAMAGIRFHGSVTITDNDVFDYCQRLSDYGAIYSWVGDPGFATTHDYSSTVTGNRMVNGRLNVEGTPVGDSAREIVAGLYVDDFVANVTATGNLIAQSPVGVYVHNGFNTQISNNKIWLTTRKALSVNIDRPEADGEVGNAYSNNQLLPLASVTGTGLISPNVYQGVPKSTYSYAYSVVNKSTGLETLNMARQYFSGNQVVMLNSPHQLAAYFLRNTATALEYNLTASGWKTLNPGETTPLLIPATYDLIKITTEGNLVPSLSAPASTPWRSGTPGFTVSQTPYVVRYTGTYGGIARAKAQLLDVASGSAGLMIPLNESEHWSGVSGLDTFTGSPGETLSYEGFMLPAASGTARLDVTKIGSGALSLSSVGIFKLTSYQVAPAAEWVKVVTGSRTAITNVTCESLWGVSSCDVKDLQGNIVPMPTTIPANENRVYLRANSTWAH